LAQSAAIALIATALRLPALFDFDPLFKLDAVIALKDHKIFSLLQVFLSGGLHELDQWQASHPGVAEEYSNTLDLLSNITH
jgi:translation initiation factor 3 subunit M